MTSQLTLQLKQACATGIDAIAMDTPAQRRTTLRKMRENKRDTIYALNSGGYTLTWWRIGPPPAFVADYLLDGGKLSDLACTIDQIEGLPA